MPLISKLLHHAESLGKNTTELVSKALLTTSGVITKWIGDGSRKEEQELAQARQTMENLPYGSAERRFFEQLAHRIKVQLSWTAADPPRPQYDGRDW